MKSSVVLQFDGRLFPDPNNNAKGDDGAKDKYKLRPRARRGGAEAGQKRPSSRAPPLSKYRRRTANARERTRMREINSAFEALRRCVPGGAASPCTPERLTKISTLRLATQYIAALAAALARPDGLDSSDDTEPSLSSGFSPSLSPDLASSLCSDFSTCMSPDFPEASLSPDFNDHSLSPFDPFLADFS